MEANAQFCTSCGDNPVQEVQGAGQPQYNNQPPSSPPGKGMAIAGLILAIAGLVTGILLAAIAGLILAVLAKKKLAEAGEPTGITTAAIVISIIGMAWGVVCIACLACGTCAAWADLSSWY